MDEKAMDENEAVCTEGQETEVMTVGLLDGQEMVADTEHVHNAELEKWSERVDHAQSRAQQVVPDDEPKTEEELQQSEIEAKQDVINVSAESPFRTLHVDCYTCKHFLLETSSCDNKEAKVTQSEESIHNGRWAWPHYFDPAALTSCNGREPSESPSVDFSIHQEGPIDGVHDYTQESPHTLEAVTPL